MPRQCWFSFFLAFMSVMVALATNAHAVRVMSVNQCVDQMVASLSVEQLVSVTWLSHQQHAPLYEVLQQVPANQGTIEEVLTLAPDLVMGGEYGASGLKTLLRRFGVLWQEIPLHQNLNMLYKNWKQVGTWLQREDEAAWVISAIQADLNAVSQQLRPLKINALIINPNGWVAGSGVFQDAFLQAVGLNNLGAIKGVTGWEQLSLEQLVYWQPDFIIVPKTGYKGRSRATEWQQHPVFAALSSRYPVLRVDAEWLNCSSYALGRAGRMILRHLSESAKVSARKKEVSHVI